MRRTYIEEGPVSSDMDVVKDQNPPPLRGTAWNRETRQKKYGTYITGEDATAKVTVTARVVHGTQTAEPMRRGLSS